MLRFNTIKRLFFPHCSSVVPISPSAGALNRVNEEDKSPDKESCWRSRRESKVESSASILLPETRSEDGLSSSTAKERTTKNVIPSEEHTIVPEASGSAGRFAIPDDAILSPPSFPFRDTTPNASMSTTQGNDSQTNSDPLASFGEDHSEIFPEELNDALIASGDESSSTPDVNQIPSNIKDDARTDTPDDPYMSEDSDATIQPEDASKVESQVKEWPRGEWIEVSMDTLNIDAWNMPRNEWDRGQPINFVRVEQTLRQSSPCTVSHNSGLMGFGFMDLKPIHYISKSSPLDNMKGLSKEYGLYQSPQHLQPLQGDVVPYLIGAYTEMGKAVLAMELPHHWAWRSASPSKISVFRYLCIAALEKVHSRGVLHGNLRMRHFIIGLDARVTIVGFRHARALVPLPEFGVKKATQQELDQEMTKLVWLLQYLSSPKDRKWIKADLKWMTSEKRDTPRPTTSNNTRPPLLTAKEARNWLSSMKENDNPQEFYRVRHDKPEDDAEIAQAYVDYETRTGLLAKTLAFDPERAFPRMFGPRHGPLSDPTRLVVAFPMPQQLLRLPRSASTNSQPGLSTTPHSPTKPTSKPDDHTLSPFTSFPHDGLCFVADKSRFLGPASDRFFNSRLALVGQDTAITIKCHTRKEARRLGLTYPIVPNGIRQNPRSSLGELMRRKLGVNYGLYLKKMQQVKEAYHKMRLEGKRLVHGKDPRDKDVTNGPPILTPDELDERREALTKFREPPQAPKAPEAPLRSALKRPLPKPHVDWERYNKYDREFVNWDVWGEYWNVDESNPLPGRLRWSREHGRKVRARRMREGRPVDSDLEDYEPPSKRRRLGKAGSGTESVPTEVETEVVPPSPTTTAAVSSTGSMPLTRTTGRMQERHTTPPVQGPQSS